MADSIAARARKLANRVLDKAGLHLVRPERSFEMDGLLARAARRGPPVGTWIDVGASDGSWSLAARRHFPGATFLLFEPLDERRSVLAELTQRYGFIHAAAAAGASPGNLTFRVDSDLDGSGVAAPHSANTRTVPVDSVDRVVAQHGLKGPYGLKLDTHGYELPILEGASNVLAQAGLVIVEAYNFTLVPGAPRFHELCAWFDSRGFRCCDLADPMRRADDGVLWQVDLAFAPANSPFFASNSFR